MQFLRIAQSGLKELETRLLLSQCVGFAAPELISGILEPADRLGRMLRSLY